MNKSCTCGAKTTKRKFDCRRCNRTGIFYKMCLKITKSGDGILGI